MSDNIHKNVKNLFPWINDSFFEKILQNEFQTSVTIITYKLKPALKHGENYTSEMLRASVNYVINCDVENAQKEINFIIKTVLRNQQLKLEVEESKMFEKEIIIYRDIFPAVQKLLTNIGDDSKFSAKCFATDDIEQSYIVFEDLSVSGYKNIDRRIGLNDEHFKKILSKLAKFHAATAVLDSQNLLPKTLFMQPNIYRNSTSAYNQLILCSLKTIAEYTIKTPGFEHISDKINDSTIDRIHKKICSLVIRDDTSFNTLLHGDLWANNMMFLYDDTDGTLKDAIMVDYQIGYWGSIGLDLSYALFSSSHESFTEQDWDYLIQYYHEQLCETMKKLEYTKVIPSLTDVHVEFLRRGAAYAGFGLIVAGARKLENVNEDGLSKFVHDTDLDRKFRYDMLNKPDMQKDLKFLLDFYYRKGFFD